MLSLYLILPTIHIHTTYTHAVPEILRSNLANTVLYLKALSITDVLHFDFLQPPAADQIAEALVTLHMLYAIDSVGEITTVGKLMSKLPLEPTVSRMIIEAR